MASFQAKTGWERPRKREKKNYRSDQFLLDPKQRIPKKQQKIQKIKKHHYGFFSGQNGTGLTEKKKKNIIVPISYYPTKNRKFQNKSGEAKKEKKKLLFPFVPTRLGIENSDKIAKNFKKFKKIIMVSFQAKTGWDQLKKRKKNYRSDQLLTKQEQKIPKKQQKNLKN